MMYECYIIPQIEKSFSGTISKELSHAMNINDIQTIYCNNSSCDVNYNCKGCLFSSDKIEIFKEWYFKTKRINKLKRILRDEI